MALAGTDFFSYQCYKKTTLNETKLSEDPLYYLKVSLELFNNELDNDDPPEVI